jgi:hypothetical protein
MLQLAGISYFAVLRVRAHKKLRDALKKWLAKKSPRLLELEQFGELFHTGHRRFAGEIFAHISGWFSIDRRHGTNRFVFLAEMFLAFSAIREK